MFMFCAADWWSGLDHAAGEEVVRAEVDLNLRMPKEDVELYPCPPWELFYICV